MTDPTIAQRFPYMADEEPGIRHWCACGQSSNQPYCDGSHKGTDITPVKVEFTEKKKVAWCGCKHTANAPYCDGTHNRLPD